MSPVQTLRLAVLLLGVVSVSGDLQLDAQDFAFRPTTNAVENYAIFSPEAIARMSSLRSTQVGETTLAKADAFLSTAPHPMSRLHARHRNESTEFHNESNLAERDWSAMLVLGLAYRISGDNRYLEADTRYFSAWASTFQPAFEDLDPIDQASTDEFMMAYDLVRDSLPALAFTEMNKVCRALAEGYTKWASNSGLENNLESHAVELAVLASYETGDPELEKRASRLFLQQVSHNIQKDGSVIDFSLRDALLYVDFDLKPLATGALSAQVHGMDWFARGGKKSIAHAVDWLIPYALGQDQHVEFVHTTLGGDNHRKERGEIWKPKSSVLDILAIATLMDTKYEIYFLQCRLITSFQPGPFEQVLLAMSSQSIQ
jgi:hypothetical protein